jgi:transposase
MWTAKNRGRYDRSKLRYPSDLTDDEWAHVEPLIPPAKRGGNKRHVEVRETLPRTIRKRSSGQKCSRCIGTGALSPTLLSPVRRGCHRSV